MGSTWVSLPAVVQNPSLVRPALVTTSTKHSHTPCHRRSFNCIWLGLTPYQSKSIHWFIWPSSSMVATTPSVPLKKPTGRLTVVNTRRCYRLAACYSPSSNTNTLDLRQASPPFVEGKAPSSPGSRAPAALLQEQPIVLGIQSGQRY